MVGSGSESCTTATKPVLILLDIGLPTLNGIEAARRIRNAGPNATIRFVREQRSRDICPGSLVHRIGLRARTVPSSTQWMSYSTETTVTEWGCNVIDSLPPSTFAEMGFGTTEVGASKVFTLSTLGAVIVCPAAALAMLPARFTTISTN